MVGRTTRKLACIRIRFICEVKSVGKAVLNIQFIDSCRKKAHGFLTSGYCDRIPWTGCLKNNRKLLLTVLVSGSST